MQTVKFNIISRDDWEVLADKQFGYFYFVVDNIEVLNAGGDLYLGENLIGSGLTIEEIVEYFENPVNEHTFPGITVGDIIPRGNTDIDVTERLGIKMQRNTRHIKDGPAQPVSVSGLTIDYENSERILKYGLNLGSGNWGPVGASNIYISGVNLLDNECRHIDSTHWAFPVVKGVEGTYGNVDLGQNNGYVVTGGKDNYVGWCPMDEFTGQLSDFTQLQYRRLSGQPVEDSTKYWFPEDDGWLCVGFTSAPQLSQDGTVTVDGVEVGCHLAMDNKKDNEAGKADGVVIDLEWQTTPPNGPDGNPIGETGSPAAILGIGASETGPGASDVFTFDGNEILFTKKIYHVNSSDLDWATSTVEYDESLDIYLWTWSATIADMKEDGSVAVTGGYEKSFKEAYSDGNKLVVIGYGSSDNPYNYPSEELGMVFYELDEPIEGTVGTMTTSSINASKYGILAALYYNGEYDIPIPETNGVFATIRYQQSGGDQIWNAIAYQKELAEVTAAALCDLNNRIENMDVDLTPVYNQIDEISQVTAAALNQLNSEVGEIYGQLETIPQWIENDYSTNPNYLTFTAETASTIKKGTYNTAPTVSIQYSKNGGSWTAFSTTAVSLAAGDNIRFRGSNSSLSTNAGYNYFIMTGKLAASGDVTSLLNNMGGDVQLNTNYCFANLFRYCTALTTPPCLPSTTLSAYCYANMFQGCTSLTTAPALPATTLVNSCYSNMFQDCSGLTIAPVLPATTIADYCYSNMFYGCTRLSVVQETLPATTLAQYCYNSMFNTCVALTKAPKLPATTLAQACYRTMFWNCYGLYIAQDILPATTLSSSCYQSMFQGCTSLTEAPVLPATALVSQCYASMFYGCSKLSWVKAMFTTTPSNTYTSSWMYNVASTGTFVKNSAATWPTTGVNAVPTGWTVQTAAA